MKKIYLILFLTSLIGFYSCNNSELENKIKELETQLDECQNGAEKLFSRMKIAYDETDFQKAKVIFEDLKGRHPDSEFFSQGQEIYSLIVNEEDRILKEEERKRAEMEAKRLASLKKLRKKFDDVSGVTWYYNPYFTHYNNSNLTSVYIGEKESTIWLRLVMSYEGDDWIFFEKAYLSYDGNTKEIVFNKYDDKKTDHDGGNVWEWIDTSLGNSDISFLKNLAESPSAKMRLSGKYTKTRNLTANEKRAIQDVLSGYEVLQK